MCPSPGLTRGLVSVILYYDGRKSLVQALRTLIAGRPGLSWSTETPDDVAEIVVEAPSQLMSDNLTENILACLTSLDWATDLAPLQKHAALGDPHHVSTVSLLHSDIRWENKEMLLLLL